MTAMEPIDRTSLYRRTAEAWNERVAAVGPDAWTHRTPCEDWTVRELVNHVTGENLWAPPLFEGATIAEVGDRFDGDLLGEDPAATARAAAADAVASAGRVPADGTVHLSFGETPVDEYLAQLAADHLVHAWDLAAATGGDRRFDPEVVAAVGAWFADREELYRSAGAIGPAATGTGDPQDDLIARFGRDPGWGR